MNSEAPYTGAVARTSDGAEVGIVVAVLGDYIQVEDEDDGRMWLSREDIVRDGDQDSLELGFPMSDLNARLVTSPDDYDQSQYLRELDDEEREQRKVMLRQLAAQRAESAAAGEVVDADGRLGEPVEEELHRMREEDGGESPPTWRRD